VREGSLVYDGPLQRVVSRFAKHEVLTVTAAQDSVDGKSDTFLSSFGEVIGANKDSFKVKLERPRASEVATHILKELNVADLNIEEPDISDIIEAIIREKGMEL